MQTIARKVKIYETKLYRKIKHNFETINQYSKRMSTHALRKANAISREIKTRADQKGDMCPRNKVSKGAWRMPWLTEAMKDVISCDKLRVDANNL